MAEGWTLGMAVVALVLVALLFVVAIRRPQRTEPAPWAWLGGLGIAMVVLGIVFGGDPLVGYGFMGVGVLLSVAGALLGRGGQQGA